ncbi:MAG: phosphatase [Lachnospiraceae bacterium]|jgi:putative hydrolase|nr:phosphatase [Lachnospiraceae bacterium]
MDTVKCDTHTHTLYSRHAFSTIEENVRAAARQGMELLATTDHFSDMLFPEVHIKHYQYLFNQVVLPRSWHGVTLLRGCEADIVDLEGHLFGHGIFVKENIVGMKYKNIQELDQFIASKLDYVIASIHGKRHTEGISASQGTKMYVKALEQEKVLILGHIGRSGVNFEVDPVLLEAKARNKLIELNEHSFDMGSQDTAMRCRKIAVRCAELGVMVSLGTDAHISCDIGKFGKVSQLLEEIHFPQELIASRRKDVFLDVIRKSGVSDLKDLYALRA